ncbi:hypothetical protein [Mesoflavibacter profundi]|uniref:hypothetical protein n=1 Tax=Mesoflavibacter profundi TaxID=2708110 RepID=UPI00168AF5EB|nr:hypothetical protein [Mesoflavibacter profundi]
MSLEEKKYDVEANNDWAKNVKGEHLFIDNAQRGRKGYFCIGCDKQMEAVIRKKNPNHRSYFRHVPVDIEKDDTPCTFSNRQYRETLATDILQRVKAIKVPNVYKYPPRGEDGAPMLLEKAKFVTAKKVKSQLTFYEDCKGAIKYGKNPEVEDRYLLIRPDVTFFDANNKPILLIELVITHKVKEEKKIKLRRLGVDTVSIIVPKSSAQEIEDNFKTTKRVKWEYNGIEASTKYIRVSSGTSEGILEFDEDQRRIFEESLTCRKARLNNTLRTIKKSLQSEPYRRAEHDFESELSRIESATKAEREGLEQMEERFEREIYAEFRGKFDEIKERREIVSTERSNFERKSRNLETRYLNKRREIEREEEELSRCIRESSDIEEKSKSIRNSIDRVRRKIKDLPKTFKKLEIESKRKFDTDRRELENEERELVSSVTEEFYRGIRSNTRKFPEGIRNILEAKRMGYDFENAKREENSYKRARELFNKGTWKAR